MHPTLPFRVYPSCGMDNPPTVPMDGGPGIYYVPGTCPDGSRIAFAYGPNSTIVDAAMIEPGADFNRARWDLHQAVLGADLRP